MMVKKVILGGTFDHVHIGHKKFLDAALEEGELIIGLVSDEMLKRWKPEVTKSYEERKKNLMEYLSRFDQKWSIIPIDDPYEEAVEGDYDVLVVSYDTKKRGKKINEKRKEIGKKPLEMKTVEPVLAEDLLPVNSSRIRAGEINEDGERLTPVRVKVGSTNKIKIKVVKDVLSDHFNLDITSVEVENVQDQPFNEDIIRIAKKRAEISGDFDYGIGIESGIVSSEKGNFSVEYTVIEDKYGFVSKGHGPGFPIPKKWTSDLKKNITLENKIKIHFDDYSDELGSIGLFTEGRIKREDCIRASLMSAMIPRLNSKIFSNEKGF